MRTAAPSVLCMRPERSPTGRARALAIKLGIRHSTSTIRRYLVRRRGPRGGQTWRTFVRNHASQIFACDFLTQPPALFTVVYVLDVMEIATRRIVLINVTTSPCSAECSTTTAWRRRRRSPPDRWRRSQPWWERRWSGASCCAWRSRARACFSPNAAGQACSSRDGPDLLAVGVFAENGLAPRLPRGGVMRPDGEGSQHKRLGPRPPRIVLVSTRSHQVSSHAAQNVHRRAALNALPSSYLP